jgi:hypothetical protein
MDMDMDICVLMCVSVSYVTHMRYRKYLYFFSSPQSPICDIGM